MLASNIKADKLTIEVKNIGFSHQWNPIFENLSFQVNSGQCVYIKGPNGAGKTTLLKLLSGLLKLDHGKVFFNSNNIQQHIKSYQKNILFIGHKLSIYPELSILDNIRYYLSLVNEPYNEDSIISTLDLIGLKYFAELHCKHLSAGQQRKVALARLWLMSRPIWILDEPFYALDQQTIQLVNKKIQQHVDNHQLVILSAHHGLDIDSNKVIELQL